MERVAIVDVRGRHLEGRIVEPFHGCGGQLRAIQLDCGSHPRCGADSARRADHLAIDARALVVRTQNAGGALLAEELHMRCRVQISDRRALIVDDEPLVRRTLARMLASRFQSVQLENASDALELLERGERFDVILCDPRIGGRLTGRDFYERLVAPRLDMADRTILMSGEPPSEKDVWALGSRWLVKPVDLSELLSVVESVCSSCTHSITRSDEPTPARDSSRPPCS